MPADTSTPEIMQTTLPPLTRCPPAVEVHSANPSDHLVHKFTHRVARGVLLAIGRPDGRLYSQTQTESWVLRECGMRGGLGQAEGV